MDCERILGRHCRGDVRVYEVYPSWLSRGETRNLALCDDCAQGLRNGFHALTPVEDAMVLLEHRAKQHNEMPDANFHAAWANIEAKKDPIFAIENRAKEHIEREGEP